MTTHEQIKAIREEKGLTQSVMAERLGIAQSSYHAIEEGPTELSIRKLVHVARALGVHPAVFGLRLSRAEQKRLQDTPWRLRHAATQLSE